MRVTHPGYFYETGQRARSLSPWPVRPSLAAVLIHSPLTRPTLLPPLPPPAPLLPCKDWKIDDDINDPHSPPRASFHHHRTRSPPPSTALPHSPHSLVATLDLLPLLSLLRTLLFDRTPSSRRPPQRRLVPGSVPINAGYTLAVFLSVLPLLESDCKEISHHEISNIRISISAMHNATVTPLSPPASPPGSGSSHFRGPFAIPENKAPLTPPQSQAPGLKTRHTPQTRTSHLKVPPTPESRIGIFLGKSLQLKGILGTGAYGVVYSAFDYSSFAWYAVKALSKFNPNGEPLDRRQREFQSREIQLHYAASAHPNIVSMLKIVDDPDCTYVILEYCPEGDLFSNITERGIYVSNDVLVQRAFLQILDAVEHCHRLGIYHRDLKPENILVSNSGHDVLLADFGLATTDAQSEDHGCGSTFYMSPECLDQSSRKPSYRCAPNDVWSLGVILVNLTCGRNPWKQASEEDSTYRAFKKDRNFLKTILPLSDELNDILGMIFESNPEDRITVSQLKQLIFHCPNFSSPPQPQYQLPSPPQSPQAHQFDVSSVSSNDSVGSSNASYESDDSMTSSGSSVSDGSDVSSQASDDSAICSIVDQEPSVPERSPLASITNQQYSLPPQEFHGNYYSKPNPCYQSWGYEHHYEPYHVVPQVQPAILNHHALFSPYSYA
ncbi:hypothetical protein G7Y89_g3930 [Cudoniella acicularis]|uniref:Autophagy-related protein 1 n=1 Tax=Cudoniella acicularis TaxID=354080 RepID=A0A8H4RQF2_9HELO|nr:hypothetical protein G7Y89_g3930 [Cudoniella acicularis]